MGWGRIDRHKWMPAAGMLLAIALMLLVNPVGFVGGGWDDWQYLMAARCWAEHGPCLPLTHWEGRWPIFAPTALAIGAFGESRLTVGLWPLLSSAAALFLLAALGNRLTGSRAGWLAAVLLLATPAFSIQLLDPSAEALELAFILLGALFLLGWRDDRTGWKIFLAGLSLGMSFQVRETALVAAVIAGLFVLCQRPSPRHLLVGAAGFLLPIAIEFAVYWQSTGDPLFRRSLSMAHTRIPTSELVGTVDTRRSPILNPDYIAHWRKEPGIAIHWTVDGLLNLFFNAKAGLTLWLAPLFYAASLRVTDASTRRLARILYAIAILSAAGLIYVFAVDPKARMFFVALSAASLVTAMLAILMWKDGWRLVALFGLAGHVLVGLVILWTYQRVEVAERAAAGLVARYPGQVEIDPNTKRHLALADAVRALPGLESDRRYLMTMTLIGCRAWLKSTRRQDSLAIASETELTHLEFFGTDGPSLCLIEYRRPLGAPEMVNVIIGTRRNGAFLMAPHFSLVERPR